MLEKLIKIRNDLMVIYNDSILHNKPDTREKTAKMIMNFDQYVLWKYLDSKEVNSQLLEELKFYENNL